jgi:hypothetical protein|tara:strand:+ start:4078 stop:4722 length:645 start_codon:yes stop_codon:yes gene_type:complete
MDKNLLGLIGAGVVAYLFLNKKNESPSELLGCIDPSASNFNNLANTDDGSCTYPMVDNTLPIIVEAPILGCTDPLADNYDLLANIDAENCSYPPVQILGCTDINSLNYNPSATIEDGSCGYNVNCYPQGCVSPGVPEAMQSYSVIGSPNCPQYTQLTPAQCGSLPISGCNDPLATNFNPQATSGCTTGVTGSTTSTSSQVSRGFNGGLFINNDY